MPELFENVFKNRCTNPPVPWTSHSVCVFVRVCVSERVIKSK